CFFVCLFFFQAEDGIRDRNVTGVQTCAPPICSICLAKTCSNPSLSQSAPNLLARIKRARSGCLKLRVLPLNFVSTPYTSFKCLLKLSKFVELSRAYSIASRS